MPQEKLIIDSDWKDKVHRDKEKLDSELKKSVRRETDLPPVSFMLHCASLATQALIFLGVVKDPVSDEVHQDLEQARFIVDTLAMLQEKTKNNLSPEEDQSLKNLLGELKLEWVKALNAKPASDECCGEHDHCH
ncbi:MAG: DUF1844 domain-containing protein [Planctomycetes bacterium]|nr:DUF1844 domain-containing protein [Planctomycetota bacterium]